jgi:hypothetical protein
MELYSCSPNTFSWRGAQLKKVISRTPSWAEYVAKIGEIKNAYKILVGKNLLERAHWGD